MKLLDQRDHPLSFFLGSGSKVKVAALKSVIHEMGIHAAVVPFKEAASKVNEQPVGENEILQGAVNRVLSNHLLDPTGDAYIAFENGIEQKESGEWVDYAIVLAFIPSSNSFLYTKSREVIFPTEQVEKTTRKPGGFVVHTVGKTLQEDGLVRLHDDPHLDLVGVSRQSILQDAITELFRKIP